MPRVAPCAARRQRDRHQRLSCGLARSTSGTYASTSHRARLTELAATLSAAELARAERFRRRADADAFVLRRGILRAVIAQYPGSAAADVRLAAASREKPFLADGRELQFNPASSSRSRATARSASTSSGSSRCRIWPSSASECCAPPSGRSSPRSKATHVRRLRGGGRSRRPRLARPGAVVRAGLAP